MASLPYGEDRFDVVTFVNSFFFAADRERTLREAKRVTASGGKVAVLMWTTPQQVELSAYVAALQPLMRLACGEASIRACVSESPRLLAERS